ncbi:MAG: hypothetical protein ACLFQV_05770, partial [Vulcanimicrobiota bacterium]
DSKAEKEASKDKKDENDKVKEPDFSEKAEVFSWSPDWQQSIIAVASVKNSQEKNEVFLVDLNNFSKKTIAVSTDTKFALPYKSHTFKDYSVWSPDDKRFFFISPTEKAFKLYIYDAERDTYWEVPRDNILSAFWINNEEMILLTGKYGENSQKEEYKPKVPLYDRTSRFFDFIPGKVEAFRWKVGTGNFEKLQELPQETKIVKVHPVTGQALCFDGERLIRISAESLQGQTPESVEFKYLPHIFESGISPDGKKIVLKKGNMVQLADMKTSSEITLEETTDLIKHVTFSADGKSIMYLSASKYSMLYFHSLLKTYDLETDKLNKVVLHFLTGSFRAVDIFPGRYPYAFYSDPVKNENYFEQITYKSGFSQADNSIALWQLFPREIFINPAPELEEVMEDTPAPEEAPEAETTPAPLEADTTPAPLEN